VIDRGPAWLVGVADAGRIPLGDRAVNLTIGSPPYLDCRTYGRSDVARGCSEWIDWMLGVTAEALRVTDGPVLWVAAGKTEDRNYLPACEGLMWEWWKRGGHAYRPCYWHRNGIMGSGGDQWFRADVEYVMAFKRPGPLPWSDNTAMGHPPRWGPGGEMSYRLKDGHRRNQWGGHVNKTIDARKRDGDYSSAAKPSHVVPGRDGYSVPALANPGNLFSTGAAGGNHLGHRLAHENDAPYPEAVPEFFIRSLAPPGGTVLDPFSGSGSTLAAAARAGRRGIGLDLRPSQARIAMRRLSRPHAPAPRASARNGSAPAPLFDRLEDTPC
jgi:hypothetical protein